MTIFFTPAGRITEGEICRGLVLHLDPDALIENGATCDMPEANQVRYPHFFICIEAGEIETLWVPAFSREHYGDISIDGRHGHRKWVQGSCWCNPLHIWRASRRAIVVAARQGKDKTTAASRNRVDEASLPRVLPVSSGERLY